MSTVRIGTAAALALTVTSLLAVACGSTKPDAAPVGSGGAPGSTGGNVGPGGAGGSGGVGGAGNVGGAGAEVGSCGFHSSLGNAVWVRVVPIGATLTGAYEGTAIVERSTPGDLVVYYEPPSTTVGAGYHATISGSVPVVPVGAKLWMTKNPVGNQLRSVQAYGQDSWSISLWDRQDGTLLLAADRGIGLKRTMGCSAPSQSCAPGLTTYYSVEVPGDTPLVLNDGETGVLERGGRSYDVHATSQKTPTAAGPNCQDYHPENTSCLDLRLRDTSGLTFEVGTPPACTAGNELVPLLYVSIPYPNTFDGRITYVETRGGSLSFEADNGMKVAVSSTMGIFPEPAVGQQFWLSMDGTLVAIRTAQAGQLVVGAVVAGGSGDSTAVLGVKVTAENDCAYTMDAFGVTYLRKVVFGSTPPVTVRTGSRGLLPLGGREYHVANNSGSVVIWK